MEKARETAERQRLLNGDAGRLKQPHVGSALDGVLQQRCLADAGLADEQQPRAAARSSRLQYGIDSRALRLPPDEHPLTIDRWVCSGTRMGDIAAHPGRCQ